MKVIWLSVLFWIGLLLGIAQERTPCEQNGKKSDIRIVVYEQGRRYILVGREVPHGTSGEGIGRILRYDVPEGLPAKRAIDRVLEEWDRVLVEAETSFCEGLDESQGEYVNLYLQVRPMNIPGTVASYRVDFMIEGKFRCSSPIFPIELNLSGKELMGVAIITVIDSQLYTFEFFSICEKQIEQAEQLVRELISDFKVKK
jgi:hypothetical protein